MNHLLRQSVFISCFSFSASVAAGICGPTIDWQDVEQYDGTLGVPVFTAQHMQSPVGQIHWNSDLDKLYKYPGKVSGRRWCTGTLISEDLFLTAGHCFDFYDPYLEMFPLAVNRHDIVRDAMHVNFNFQYSKSGELQEEAEYDILELLEYRVGGVDYALLRLDGKPGEYFNFANIRNSSIYPGMPLTIVQHPRNLPKVISSGVVSHTDNAYVYYKHIDTEQGSSGSGVLNTDGELLAVHARGSCSSSDPESVNGGIPIQRIIAQSPTITLLADQEQKRPNAAFNYDITELTVAFSDESNDEDGYIVEQQWDYGDGNTSSVISPLHVYSQPGRYKVTLTVTDDAGVSHLTARDIEIKGDSKDCPVDKIWRSDISYQKDHIVVYENVRFIAKWWTLNQQPSVDHANSANAWAVVGSCT